MRAILLVALLTVTAPHAATQPAKEWTIPIAADEGGFVSSGRVPYFVLEPGYVLTLAGGDTQLIITVLPETKEISGTETRIVEERETKAGTLIEVSRNYFAIGRRTNSVFYFGEDVDIYKGGKVISHEGAWLAGVNDATAGVAMPGMPMLGARYYQERAPGVAMDRAEIVNMSASLKTPMRLFTSVLVTRETTPLEPGVSEPKYYARDVGLIGDGDLRLVAVK